MEGLSGHVDLVHGLLRWAVQESRKGEKTGLSGLSGQHAGRGLRVVIQRSTRGC